MKKRWLFGCAFAIVGLAVWSVADDPEAVTIAPFVRDSLARVWDDTNARQVERGYCLKWNADKRLAYEFSPSHPIGEATPMGINFKCGPGTVSLHIHTPTSCTESRDSVLMDTCVVGGPLAYVCTPSLTDVVGLIGRRDPLAFIQCARYEIRPFFAKVL